MSYERSVGAIIFRARHDDEHREPMFLLLRYPGEYWEFARGHVEEGERERMTARREIVEETGLTNIRFVQGFRERYRFHFRREGREITKDAILYLAEARTWDVRVSEEHRGYAWVTYGEAMQHLHFENSKAIMRKVRRFLRERVATPAATITPRGRSSS